MILTCPECTTRYFVEDSKLGPDGRTVRCANCGNSWHAEAEAPLELVSSAEEGAVGRSPGKAEDPAGRKAPELPKAFRAKVQQQRKVREAATAGVVWAGMVTGLASLLVAAYVFRVDVVKLYPSAAGAYALARVPVNPTGLEFDKVKGEPAPDGAKAITVSGVVRNVEDEPAAPPPLRVSLLDDKGKKLVTRVVRVPAATLAPGKSVAFSAVLPDPKAAADDVAVEFALDLQPKPGKAAAQAAKPASHGERRPTPALRPMATGPHGPARRPATQPHASDGHGDEARKPSGDPAAQAPKPKPSAKPTAAHASEPQAASLEAQNAILLRRSAVPQPRAVEAKPLPANDPYSLDTRH